MKAKFASGVTPFRGKYQGGVYQSFSAGNQILSNKRNSRSRYPNQLSTAAIMAKVTRAWAFLTSGERDSWNGWAATYPQPCRYRSGCYLTGYQNFLQRNFYELLFFGINAPLITNPALSVVADSSVTPQLTRSGADLLLNYSWSRSGGDIWAGVFVSHIVSGGKLYNLNYPRFVGVIDNGGGFVPLYGCLYNWYCCNYTPKITSSDDWYLILQTQGSALTTYLGGANVAGGKMKEVGFDYWNSPNKGASNSTFYNGRGAGHRNAAGSYSNFRVSCLIWYPVQLSSTHGVGQQLITSSANKSNVGFVKNGGHCIRVSKNAPGIADGVTTTYVGNDGKNYNAVCINQVYHIQSNLCETKFRDGSEIPYIQGNTAWSVLTSPSLSFPNGDIANAFTSGSTSADISEGWGRNFGVLPNVGDYLILRFVKVGKANGQFLGEEKHIISVS